MFGNKKKSVPENTVDPNNPAQMWVLRCLQSGYKTEQITAYLHLHGYDDNHINYLLQPFVAQAAPVQMPVQKPQNIPDFHEKLSPTNAHEFFIRAYALLRYPSFFFSHLYSSEVTRGFRMVSFSLLVAISLGILFWFSYYFSGLFLIAPSFVKSFISLPFTLSIFAVFFLIFVVCNPLYYFVIHRKNHALQYKQYFGGLLYAVTPFVLFATVPLLNLIGILWSLHLADSALRSYLSLDEKTIFDISVIYTIGFALIALVVALLFTGSQTVWQERCIVYPSGECSVHLLSWSSFSINGIDNNDVTVYNKENQTICWGTDQNVECKSPIASGGYFFVAGNNTGAFTLII